MKTLTPEQYEQIKDVLPVHVKIGNFLFLQAVFYVAENGCKWRKRPKDFGK